MKWWITVCKWIVMIAVVCLDITLSGRSAIAQDYFKVSVWDNYHRIKARRNINNDLFVRVTKLGSGELIKDAQVTMSVTSGQVEQCVTGDGDFDLGTCWISNLKPLAGDDYVNIEISKDGFYTYKRKLTIGDGTGIIRDANIEDCVDDDFLLPSCDFNGSGGKDLWEPDFWLAEGLNLSPDPPLRIGESVTLQATLINSGSATCWSYDDFKVDFYWAHPSIGLNRTQWKLIGSASNEDPEYPTGGLPDMVEIDWVPTVETYPPGWPKDGTGTNHFCFFVEVSSTSDPASIISNPKRDNNLSQHNFSHCFWDECEPGDSPSPASPASESNRTETCNEVKYNFLVGNPDTLNPHDVFLKIELIEWVPSMDFELEPFVKPDPNFVQIDPLTFSFQNMAPGETKTALLTLTSPSCEDIGTLHITGTIDDDLIGGIAVQTIPSECPIIEIEKKHDVLQGHFVDVSISARGGLYEMGGFDFLLGYDATAISAIEAKPGQLLEDCGWESFAYRHNNNGNCGNACPSGMMRLTAIAETNNGPAHAECFGPEDCEEYELAKVTFFVSNDRTLECQYVPIYFYWDDCGDNTYSSVDGEILYIERRVYDHDGSIIWDEGDDVNFPEDNRKPHIGASDDCLNTDPAKPPIRRCPVFKNGGIDIVCSDSIDLRGDVNCNGVPYEIADAVAFANYFISGEMPCGEAGIAASDVNADGVPLSIADLVYLIRVILGDASPYPKALPQVSEVDVALQVNHSAAAVAVNSATDIGGGYFEFDHTGYEIGEPQLINGASDMTLKYADENGVLRVLVYSMEKDRKIPAGTQHIFAVPISGEGTIAIRDAELSDYFGNLLTTRIDNKPALPARYALHQNYPNPFNATTTIMYELPVNTHVTIAVFNTLGQKVATLIDRQEEAGIHSVAWDGADHSGTTVASGVYIYRISTAAFTTEKKMVLMK